MTTKKTKTLKLLMITLLFLLCAGIGIIFGTTKQIAFAASDIRYYTKHTTNGTVSWVATLPYNAGGTGSAEYTSNSSYASYFAVYLQGYSNSSTTAAAHDKKFNDPNVNITAQLFKTVNPYNNNYPFGHKSATLQNTTTGSTITSKTFSGSGTVSIYSGYLSDGNYTLTYVASGTRSGVGAGTITHTYTYRFIVDSTAPNYTLTAGGSSISSGSYVNSLIGFSASDRYYDRLYYQRPGSSSFSSTTSSSYSVSATSANNGLWNFYAGDTAGNMTTTVSVYLDTIIPTGSITATSGSTLANGAYSKYQAKYTATDTGGVARCEYKTPGSSTWTTYSAGTNVGSTAGIYTFRAIDKAGNISAESYFYYDSTVPTGNVYKDNTVTANGSKVQAGFIKYVATDNSSGISACYVKEPGQTSYKPYTSGTPFTKEGTYSFYSVDRANNTSATLSITLDNTKPTCTLYGGTTARASGSCVNDAYVKFNATDDNSGIAGLYVKKPNSSSYGAYTANEQLTDEGVYSFYATDNAGVKSDFHTITLDRTKPTITLRAGGKVVASGYNTNDDSIEFSSSDALSGVQTMYVKKPNTSAFSTYTQSLTLSGDGLYQFYSVDRSGNQSEVVHLIWDKVMPISELYAGANQVDSGKITNAEYIRYVANDATSGVAQRYVKMPGEKTFIAYNDGTQLSVEGEYCFYSVDKAQNRSQEVFITIDRTLPVGTVKSDSTTIPHNGFSNAANLSYHATDNVGVEILYVKYPNTGGFVPFADGTAFSAEGRYEFYCKDIAGNISETLSVTLDRTIPSSKLFAESKIIDSGTKTNAQYIRFAAADTLSGIKNVFVKSPNSSAFVIYNGANLIADGSYEFYAIDNANNRTDTVTAILDHGLPQGTLYAAMSATENNSYTSASYIKFDVTDTLSGISESYVKMPGDTKFIAYTSGNALTVEGTYTFYAIDGSGNRSIDYNITIDRTNPTDTLYAGTKIVSSGTVTNASYVTFSATDNIALKGLFVKKPAGKDFIPFTNGTQFTEQGEYSFYSEDNAGNRSETVAITLDTAKPTLQLYADNASVEHNTYTNANSISATATDNLSGIKTILVKFPFEADFVKYEVGYKFTQDGRYEFRAYDNAGNESGVYAVTLDTVAPNCQLYANDTKVDSGSYTNLDRIYLLANDVNLAACYVLAPNATDWKTYTNGALYSALGKYEFYSIDLAGNRSNTYKIVIDRSEKPLSLNGVLNGKTDTNVTISWTDGNANVYAPIVSVTVNGISYTKNSPINTITDGRYQIQSIDAAGNVWATEFVSTQKTVRTETANQEWWEATNTNGQYYAFDSYANALSFATERELTTVRSAEWLSADAWDTGLMMDAIDSVNAKPGKFYVYKKSGDSSVQVAYFTEERLHAVIREYAESGITHHYYFESNPSVAADGNDLYKLNTEGIFLADKILLTDKAHYYIDGELYNSIVYDISGKHNIVVKDDYGNEKSYTFIVVRDMPTLSLAIGESGYVVADLMQTYYLKSAVKIKITDELDDYAMFYVKDASGNVLAMLSLSDEYEIAESGTYTVQAVNHFGRTEDLQIRISLNAPSVSFGKNAAKKQFLVAVNPSVDAALQSVTVYKSVDGGKTWNALTTDDYGTLIGVKTLKYAFRTSGMYKVVIEDAFHTGFEAIEKSASFRQIAPVGTLKNVENGSYTNKDVVFTWSEEATATVTMNGEISEYKSGEVLRDEGIYEIVLTNYDGQTFVVTFVIDKTAPEFELVGAENENTVNSDVCAKWTDENLVVTVTFDGKTTEYLSGTHLAESGFYKLTFTDRAGNTAEATFAIDKKVDFEMNTADGFITSEDVIIKANEELVITLKMDNENVPYAFGEALTLEGNYEAELTDLYGNKRTVTFRIFKQSIVNTFDYDFDGATATLNGDPCEKLNFSNDGIYVISVEQNGTRYSFTIQLDTLSPTVNLIGVNNGDATKSDVTILDLSEEATVEVYLNGEKISYSIGSALTELGDYRIVVTDKAGNASEYTFSIIYSLNGGAIAIIVIGILLLIAGVLTFIFVRKSNKFRKKKSLKIEPDEPTETESK